MMSNDINSNMFVPTNWERKDNRIKIIGVGGCGGNAVNMMFHQNFQEIDFVITNTDKSTLDRSPIKNKIQLGTNLTKGLGAGCNPTVGRNAALESKEEIERELSYGTEVAFILAGMGGGTGTGAAPVIAQLAKEKGILTIAVVTRPFKDELIAAEKRAYDGIMELSDHVDSMLIIDNDKIYDICEDLNMHEAFERVNEVICTAVRGIIEIVTGKGEVQVDFADLKMAMKDSGMAYLGMGQGKGKDRALDAIQNALKSPLLHECNMSTVKKALVNITYREDNRIMKSELKTIMDYLNNIIGRNIDFKRGLGLSEDLEDDTINVTVVATGLKMKLNPPEEEEAYDEEHTITMEEREVPESAEISKELGEISKDTLFSDIDMDHITLYTPDCDLELLERETALRRFREEETDTNIG